MSFATARRDQIQRYVAGPGAPSSLEAEKALIGLVLAHSDAFDMIEGLTAAHFYEPLHGRLWAAIAERHAKGGFADPTLLDGQFANDEGYREAGGLHWLSNLLETAPGPSRAQAYATEVRERAGRRALLTLARDVEEKARDPESGSLPDVLAELEAGAAEIARIADTSEAWLNPADMIGGALERARASKGVIEFPIGIPELDRLLGGMHRTEVTILAARPGMGKTVGAQAWAKASARAGMATPFFSLEMGEDPMALRLACDLAYDRDAPVYLGRTSNITLEKIARCELDDAEWGRLQEAQRTVASWPLRFDTRAGHTMARIEALARRFYRKADRRGIKRGPLIIDHMGKVRPTKNRNGNLRLETADISRDAAEMAKRLDVPVLLLCQLSRAVEGRNDRRPTLADLREAGQIEEDARQVIFLYRPEYYLREPVEDETPAERIEREAKLDQARNKLFWIVEKNSHGPRGQALTFCDIAASAVREWRL